jgi:hypothetical protein
MEPSLFTTLILSGLAIAFFHSAIPTHWLPFVLTSRVQGWSARRTLAVTMLAGSSHVLITALIGLLLTTSGKFLNWSMAERLSRMAGFILIGFGAYYLIRQLIGRGHVHFGYPHEHPSGGHSPTAHRVSDRTAILSLLAFLTLSPCEAFIPIYVSAIRFGWGGFALLTAILSLGTVAGMVVFTSLTLAGLQNLSLTWMEKYESGVIAALLCIVGVLILIFER